MEYYVKLKDDNQLSVELQDLIKQLELETYEKRFPFPDQIVEVYIQGTLTDCQQFLDSISNNDLKSQFVIEKNNE